MLAPYQSRPLSDWRSAEKIGAGRLLSRTRWIIENKPLRCPLYFNNSHNLFAYGGRRLFKIYPALAGPRCGGADFIKGHALRRLVW